MGSACVLILVALWSVPRIQERLAPRPVAAWVAIEAAGSEAAVVGRVELTSETPFRIHAVLEAEATDGSPVYYTHAPHLRLEGRQIPDAALRRWDRPQEVRVLWFTVEGVSRYLSTATAGDLDRFRFEEFLRPEWGTTWSIEGSLDSHSERRLAADSGIAGRSFGTQRFQAWIEIYDEERAMVPSQRFKSHGAADLPARADSFATVVSSLAGPAAQASNVFGLTQIDVQPGADTSLLARVSDLAQRQLAFSRLTVLRNLIRASGQTLDELQWTRVDLGTGRLSWSRDVGGGDLLRVGGRVVVLWRDAGVAGTLDSEDLCFDFEKGASVRPLGQIFSGPGDVEWARLQPSS